ncbi:DUF493 domain-containing protein [Acidiferrobacter sp.]|uniref:YbeD family protein n=1 Tax=Acidiferrobacter sp. TaxID=1872107 RepID=UPI00261A87EE|nr:DUF493 domain-containing protein [Acidiferrobacter sp.]
MASNGHNGKGAPLLTFPCTIDIKAIGRQSVRFEALIHEIVSRHIMPQDLLSCVSRASRGGTYTAVTLTIRATDKAQLDAIYEGLKALPEVLIAL